MFVVQCTSPEELMHSPSNTHAYRLYVFKDPAPSKSLWRLASQWSAKPWIITRFKDLSNFVVFADRPDNQSDHINLPHPSFPTSAAKPCILHRVLRLRRRNPRFLFSHHPESSPNHQQPPLGSEALYSIPIFEPTGKVLRTFFRSTRSIFGSLRNQRVLSEEGGWV